MTEEQTLDLQRCDLVFTRSDALISKVIRLATRSFGESKTMVSHVGQIVTDSPADLAMLLEARVTGGVQMRCFSELKGQRVAVYRPIGINPMGKALITQAAIRMIGARYGLTKLVAHFLDAMLNGAFIFRRLTGDSRPICSKVPATAYGTVGLDFGVPSKQAQPDDIWDFCRANPDKYKLVIPLRVLT